MLRHSNRLLQNNQKGRQKVTPHPQETRSATLSLGGSVLFSDERIPRMYTDRPNKSKLTASATE